MKKVILLILFGLSYSMGYAQPTGELYFSLTPQDRVMPQNQTEGIYKSVDNANDPMYKAPRYFFRLESKSRNIHITFAHISVNPDEWYKTHTASWNDQMETKTTDINLASRVNIYNLDSFFRAKSRDELIDWLERLDVENKKIYFFDSRDVAKGKINLIQVELLDYGLNWNN